MSLLSLPKLLDGTAQFVGDAVSATVGTPYGQFIRGVGGSKDRVYGTEIFKDNEIDVLKDLAKEQVKQGSYQINYKNIGADITSKLSYNMKLPDKMSAKDAIATTLGTSSLRRDGDRLIIVDEYDFQKPLIVQYAFSTAQEFTIIKYDTLEGILEAGQEVEFEFLFNINE